MSKVSNKELGDLIREAESQGWKVQLTAGNHYKWQSPIGRFIFTASTPSDRRALMNIRRDLKQYGFIEVKRKKGRR